MVSVVTSLQHAVLSIFLNPRITGWREFISPDLKESLTTMWKTTWTCAKFECLVMKTSPVCKVLLFVIVLFVCSNEINKLLFIGYKFMFSFLVFSYGIPTCGSLPSRWWDWRQATASFTSSRIFSNCSSIGGKWNSVVSWQIKQSSGKSSEIESLEIIQLFIYLFVRLFIHLFIKRNIFKIWKIFFEIISMSIGDEPFVIPE